MGAVPINHEAVPGTTTLVDLEKRIKSRHAKGQSDIVLIPTPSDDPDDPLNWSLKRKYISLFCTVVYVYAIGVPSAAIYSVLSNVSAETGLTLTQLNRGTGYMFLFLGLGCAFFQPLALQYGKRPVYLLTTLATMAISVWAPYTQSNPEWIGSKILQGFFGSPAESLCETSISDIFFEHERATMIGIYGISLTMSNYLASVIAGFITQGMGWQWVMWWCAVFDAVCFIFLFLFQEETNYNRKLNVDKLEVIDGIAIHSNDGRVPAAGDEEQKIDYVTNENSEQSDADGSLSATDEKKVSTKTFVQKLSLTSGRIDKFILPYLFIGTFKMAQFPSVLWAGFINGSSLVWFNLLNATASKILSAEPYNFSPSARGLAYLSPVICSLCFYVFAAPLSDWIKVWFARRRGGLSYAEDRIWILSIRMVIGLLASIGWGVGAYYGVHWFVLILSMGVLGGSGIFSSVTSITYATDCYYDMSTEAMVILILIRNCMSYACSYGLTDWVDNLGLKNAFINSGFALFGSMGTFIIMRYTGPWWRSKLKYRYWNIVEDMKAKRGSLH
ncbi:CYFA0S35e00320g1_1 [Cyberlindnera fabianii]|uniref:CYFA0S35e00320g1_1 n=1 Tax=Cyberlindnera fabianii TaxID=36022 RepID=A0A061BE47_CYBFA|nr:Protein HOL1 [Cyberlindnera fabianii]CDR47629.1 CYFA0S35e00320g1_1 [Cyberlindnera fabianii]